MLEMLCKANISPKNKHYLLEDNHGSNLVYTATVKFCAVPYVSEGWEQLLSSLPDICC